MKGGVEGKMEREGRGGGGEIGEGRLGTFQGERCLWSQLGLITMTKEGSYRATSLRCSGPGVRVVLSG